MLGVPIDVCTEYWRLRSFICGIIGVVDSRDGIIVVDGVHGIISVVDRIKNRILLVLLMV